jgi:hypothetical protein
VGLPQPTTRLPCTGVATASLGYETANAPTVASEPQTWSGWVVWHELVEVLNKPGKLEALARRQVAKQDEVTDVS